MNQFISKLNANILAIYYNADIYYHHINSKGYWEFEIGHKYWDAPNIIYFKTKGIK